MLTELASKNQQLPARNEKFASVYLYLKSWTYCSRNLESATIIVAAHVPCSNRKLDKYSSNNHGERGLANGQE